MLRFTDLLGGAARRREGYRRRKTLSSAWAWNAEPGWRHKISASVELETDR